MAWYEGPCRITVIGLDADWPQRAVVTVSGARGARIEVPGEVGTVQHVDAPSWHLEVEHLYEGRWRPNVRAVRSRWETVGGVRTQTITSKDVDWPGGNRHERNLVLRLEWVGEEAERPRETVREAPARAVTQSAADTPARRAAVGSAPAPTRSSSSGSVLGAPPATSWGATTTSSSPW
ncbi:hypothetical protein F7R91_34315 [Streptomyces luteolifulvus]|jgi:hypothetical protein|uniref:Uncharacterized protein n=1 Tax=Streptomyces luteolifulvus TaxID=2615112 RepID=A0A6H9URE4_9ACTN|nr:hypothetical protein [Streptomyces luteolifulvus]KAB1140920.1 hypothetical protein F7R91_34315 [Streptomyces luteolifulvus]